MDLVEHLEALCAGGSQKDQGEGHPGVQELHAALRALSISSKGAKENAVEVDALEGIEHSKTLSLWQQIFQQHQSTPKASDNQLAVTGRLLSHLRSVSQGDEGLFQSVLSDVRGTLEKQGVSDELISSQLAETIGFDQLELVSDLIGSKRQVCADLRSEGHINDAALQALMDRTDSSNGSNDIPHISSRPVPSHPNLSASSKPYVPGSSMVIQTKDQILEAKRRRAEQRRYDRARAGAGAIKGGEDQSDVRYTAEEMAMLRAQSLQAASNRPLFTSDRSTSSSEPQYPHVYASQGGGGSVLSAFGAKFSLPVGTSRIEHSFFEEVTIPPPKQLPLRGQERLVPISEMDPLARGAFPGYASLNRLQSAVYPLGYGSNENLLVCAPTGAGKTDVAMLTVLRTIKMHARRLDPTLGETFGIRHNDFKIIYVAPMKALASEIVTKFSKRLRYLGVKVRELTGDMQLTRQEIAETQMIVTTPEKWDVVTRKPTGEGELATKVRLLIIDEVHLLHEDRGAVIETIVARTLRLVESSQSLIRIVGLSATLPNYVDVADFLRVNRYQGLFFFDSSFRPVPLEQHFLGVKGKINSAQSRQNHDKATFEKLSTLIGQGHQMMIFVHARKETVKTATTMREMCKEEGLLDDLLRPREEGAVAGKVNMFRRDIMESRNRELKELFETGFGIHHAGMLRKDRNLSERLFEAGVTRVLCCTSTLAWGVNLPAYAVLIKGTDVYDSSLGRFSDLSILDVLQIFGRAGRPQYESVGVGYIITSQDKLSHYVDAITSQHPIESKFKTGMIDALNAEIALGSVSSVSDGVTWLSYTYLFTRMKRNPLAYGMLADEVADDPQLGARRLLEITTAAKYLAMCKMLQFDPVSGQFTITELGRIAAKYYITYKTIEVFNAKLKSQMSEADIFAVFSQATDFEQVIPRETEVQELKKLEEKVPCQIIGACETSSGKTNLLLQAYISRLYVEDFALVSDAGYVSQNAGRVIRALLEIALSNRWAVTSTALLGLTKAVERRMWPFDHPLEESQSGLKPDLVYQIKRWADEVDVRELANMDKEELAKLCKVNDRHAEVIRNAARSFPMLSLEYKLKPITHDLVSVEVSIGKEFEWKQQGREASVEPFHVWIESEDGTEILQRKRILLRPQSTTVQLNFIVDTLTTSCNGLWIRWASDKWLGSEDVIHVPFDSLTMPPVPRESTLLLDLPLLTAEQTLHVLGEGAKSYFSQQIATLNSLETQSFHAFAHSHANLLYCAPSRSGKSTLAHIAIWRLFEAERNSDKVVALAVYPNASLAFQAHVAWRRSAAKVSDVQSLLWRTTKDAMIAEHKGSIVIFTTPVPLLEALRDTPAWWLTRLRMVVLEDLNCVNAAFELAVSTLRRFSLGKRVRWIATSTTLLHTRGVQSWLDVKDRYAFNFQAKDRPSALKTNIIAFDLPHSLNLLKVMIKPAYDRIRKAGAKTKAIIFVPSRTQCYSTAKDLITQSASELDTEAFLGVHPSELEPYLRELSDASLKEPLRSGIAIIHEGIKAHDRTMILSLYSSKVINLLIVARESMWSLTVSCDVVILMSIQFFRGDVARVEDILTDTKQQQQQQRSRPSKLFNAKLVDYPINDIIRIQSFAAQTSSRSGPTQGGECLIMCQEDQVSFVRRMLDDGFVLESTLLDGGDRERALLIWFTLSEVGKGRLLEVKDFVQMLNWTLIRRQMELNPSFYEARSAREKDLSEKTSQIADEIVQELRAMRCLEEKGHKNEKQGQQLLFVTKVGHRVIADQAMLFALFTLTQAYRSNPDHVARLLMDRIGEREKNRKKNGEKGGREGEEVSEDDEATSMVFLATKSCIPSESLARFGVPKSNKKEAGEAPLTVLQKRALLLAVYFTAGADIKTSGEAAVIKSNSRRGDVSTEPSEDTQMQAKANCKELMFELMIRTLSR